MIKHKLRMLILKQLKEKPRSGYGLIKDIERMTGWKPSYGSIYPALDHLKEEGLVTYKEEGRKKVYSLTEKGKQATKEIKEHHAEILSKFREMNLLISHVLGIETTEADDIATTFLSGIVKGDNSFKDVLKPSMEMKKEFWRIYKAGLLKQHKKEIIAIFDDATERLKRIK